MPTLRLFPICGVYSSVICLRIPFFHLVIDGLSSINALYLEKKSSYCL